MSVYALQKLIRAVISDAGAREAFFRSPETAADGYALTDAERRALIARDYTGLYRLGVHGLLLRPFSILHGVSEPDYLDAIRKERQP